MEAPGGLLEDLGEILGGLEKSWGGFVTVRDGLEAVLGRSGDGLGCSGSDPEQIDLN